MWSVRSLLAKSKLLTFVLLMLFGTIFGVSSLNLFMLFKANIELFLDNGLMVIRDGALDQLLELLAYLFVSMSSYVMFKACEVALVRALLDPKPDDG